MTGTALSAEAQYKKMTETPIGPLVIKLGIPTTISMLVTNIYNMADTYFVGLAGDGTSNGAVGAVGVVFGLMAIIQAFGFMFGHGSGSIISRRLGQKDVPGATKIASTGFCYAFAFGILIEIIGFCCLEPLMRLFGATDTILPFAKDYCVFILLAAPFMTTSFLLNNILRYEGKAVFAMVGLVTGGLLNIFGDWLLITQFNLGVKGAGISTAVSELISFTILFSMFLRGKTSSKINPKYFSKSFKDAKDIVTTGLPSLVRQCFSSVSTSVLNNLAGTVGAAEGLRVLGTEEAAAAYADAAIAAMTIVNKICFFVFAIGLGIGQGFQPVSAFNYGAGKYKRVKKAFFFTLFVAESFLGVLAIVGLFIAPKLIALFTSDPIACEIATDALRIQLLALFFQPVCVCTNMLFQSIGKSLSATILATLRSGLAFIPTIIILSGLLGLRGVEMSQTVADAVTFSVSLPFMIYFFKHLPEDNSHYTN